MEKKKISKEDLELNFEVVSSNSTSSANDSETDITCDPTEASAAFCKTTADDERCDPDYTNKCTTLVCQTINCVDSNSRAQYCCPVTQQDGCKPTVNNCITQVTCNVSKDICPATEGRLCLTGICVDPVE